MGGIEISAVKFVGVCSKCRDAWDEIPKYKDGKIIEDKDIACILCFLEGKNQIVEKELQNANKRN